MAAATENCRRGVRRPRPCRRAPAGRCTLTGTYRAAAIDHCAVLEPELSRSQGRRPLAANCECPIWVIRDRRGRSGSLGHVRFAPKATDVLRCPEMTRRARKRHRSPLFDHPVGLARLLRRRSAACLLPSHADCREIPARDPEGRAPPSPLWTRARSSNGSSAARLPFNSAS